VLTPFHKLHNHSGNWNGRRITQASQFPSSNLFFWKKKKEQVSTPHPYFSVLCLLTRTQQPW
jgi:hypothetical protein